jgi:hypothetical protein
MTTNDKKAFVRRVGLPVTALTQVLAAAQPQPAQVVTTTEFAAPAGAPVPGNEPGSILRTMSSANAAHRGQIPACITTSITFEGQSGLHLYSNQGPVLRQFRLYLYKSWLFDG